MRKVKDILDEKGADIIVATGATTVHEAAVMMSEANTGSIAVKEANELLGIFTERDLMRRVVVPERDPAKTLLADVMTHPVCSVGLETPLSDCFDIMEEKHIRHLVVLEDNALIGLVSLRDVLNCQAGDE